MKTEPPLGITELSDCEMKYILAIFELGGDSRPIKISDLSKHLNLALPTVSIMVRKLAKRGLVCIVKRGYITLTNNGCNLACMLIHAHGILEHIFVKAGLSPNEACCIASKIQNKVPYTVIMELWEKMGKPSECPHGIPMVKKEGRVCPCNFCKD
ncbi:MAG: hypothetical protein DRO18_06410 [Thermoprotei archaeon]|nr:MAG: hypothetical protein DRO18_06410 [Thermoprotei archaeon]